MSVDPPTAIVPSPDNVVSVRTLVVAVIAASLLSIGGAVALSYALIGRPEPGPRGPQRAQVPAGETGPRGPAGHAEVDEDAVWQIVESDPQRVTNLVEDNLDPSPADVQSEVEDLSGQVDDVASNLSSLCSDLSLTDALSNEVLSCP
jgi:hypothetical protein